MSDFTIIVDSREQKPYSFTGYTCNVKRSGLKTGDYSIEGYESVICVERKSKEDLYSSLGNSRKRFEAEFQRMSEYEYRALVVEATLQDLMIPPNYSAMTSNSVINSVISWGIRYGVQVYFAGSRILGECLTYRILEKFLYNKNRKAA